MPPQGKVLKVTRTATQGRNGTTGEGVESDENNYTGMCHLIFRIEFLIVFKSFVMEDFF